MTLAKLSRPGAVLFLAGMLLPGCGPDPARNQEATALQQERERLQAENQDLAKVTAENQEVQQLRKENQDLPKLRSQYQEAIRLRKDNEQLRQQIAKISPATAANQLALAGMAQAGQGPLGQAGAQTEPDKAQVGQGTNTLNEGDEVMLDPKDLKQLLPDIDWDKLGRKEPLGVRALLEKDGIQLTNIQQLQEFGLTNYTIRRAPPKPQAPAPESR